MLLETVKGLPRPFKVRASRILSFEGSGVNDERDPSLCSGRAFEPLNIEQPPGGGRRGVVDPL